jgi:hypothetical protein
MADNWQQKIEAQIEYLTTMLGVQFQQRSRPSMMLAESIESLKLLLDVAVAADTWSCVEPIAARQAESDLHDALDKLKETAND